MFRTFYKRQLVGLALGLGLVAAAPAFAAPPATVTVPDSLARIQYPGTSSKPTVYLAGPIVIPERLTRIQYPGTSSQPTVYPSTPRPGAAAEKTNRYGQIAIPAWLARVQYPGTSSLPTVFVTPSSDTSGESSFDWGSAGVGAGFVAGLGLVALGAALALRRRRQLVHT
jgi:MYXO-CTERM domain-containing protein